MRALFAIGDKVKDKITGYNGTITSITFTLDRPVCYKIESLTTINSVHTEWIDEPRLVAVEECPFDDKKYNDTNKDIFKAFEEDETVYNSIDSLEKKGNNKIPDYIFQN